MFASIAARTALLMAIADRLDDIDRPVARLGIERLERLLAEPAPFRDYGPRAIERNARINSILEDLETEEPNRVAEQTPQLALRNDGDRRGFSVRRKRRTQR